MRTDDECQHDFLDEEGFCIDCGVHISDRISVPKLDDSEESDPDAEEFAPTVHRIQSEATRLAVTRILGARPGQMLSEDLYSALSRDGNPLNDRDTGKIIRGLVEVGQIEVSRNIYGEVGYRLKPIVE